MAVMRELKGEAELLGAVEYSAIATEVFRTAPNGPAFLDRLQSELGVKCAVAGGKRRIHLP